jgi:hypothetical protein
MTAITHAISNGKNVNANVRTNLSPSVHASFLENTRPSTDSIFIRLRTEARAGWAIESSVQPYDRLTA